MEELTQDLSGSPLYNKDLAPTRLAERTWNKWHLASLWIGMAVCIPTYMLAAGLLGAGLTWGEAVLTIFLGNFIVLIPMVLIGHAGTKYGLPLPVFLRASFGSSGAHIPAIMRGLVACGWFGIQTWIGGEAVYRLLAVLSPGVASAPLLSDFLGLNLPQLICFLAFWLVNLYFVIKGTESIKWLETLSAPVLILIGVGLLAWGIRAGGSLGRVLDHSTNFAAGSRIVRTDAGVDIELRPIVVDGAPRPIEAFRYAAEKTKLDAAPWIIGTSVYHEPVPAHVGALWIQPRGGAAVQISIGGAAPRSKWMTYLALLTAMVGFWATLALNIPDFTRYARSQKDQLAGQAIGLPTTMTFYSFVGVAVTCAALLAFPDILLVQQAPWDPVALMARFPQPAIVVVSMIMLLVATLTTNIAANVVAPANGFANLAPKRISFRTGGVITAVIGILIMPWKLIATTQGYIFGWLIAYSALLGPIAGILIADYFVVRRTRLDLAALYRPSGVRIGTLVILALAIAPNVPGFLAGFVKGIPQFWQDLFNFAWFVGFAIAFVLYSIAGMIWKPTRTT